MADGVFFCTKCNNANTAIRQFAEDDAFEKNAGGRNRSKKNDAGSITLANVSVAENRDVLKEKEHFSRPWLRQL